MPSDISAIGVLWTVSWMLLTFGGIALLTTERERNR